MVIETQSSTVSTLELRGPRAQRVKDGVGAQHYDATVHGRNNKIQLA
jgi:hypothetical protein